MATTPQNSQTLVVLTLVNTLLPIVLQYGLPIVVEAVEALKKDPTLPADALAEAITKRLEEASKKDNAILNEN